MSYNIVTTERRHKLAQQNVPWAFAIYVSSRTKEINERLAHLRIQYKNKATTPKQKQRIKEEGASLTQELTTLQVSGDQAKASTPSETETLKQTMEIKDMPGRANEIAPAVDID